MRRDWLSIHAALVFAINGSLSAQSQSLPVGGSPLPTNAFVCRTWQVEDGLPQNSVLAIVQTRDGYIWLATANGLARFDGVQFRRFGLADGLSSLYVRVLLEDREGALWIGTVNGLSRYRNGQFTTWTTHEGLAGNWVLALAEDREGAIWVATNTGLSRGRNGVFETMGREADIADRYVAALAADRRGGVWISVTGLGLLRWDGAAFGTPTQLPTATKASTTRMLRDRVGRIWAGVFGTVYCLDGDEWKEYGAKAGLPPVSITSLAETADGTLWIGSLDGGLFYLREGKVCQVAPDDGLSDTSILSLMEDRENNLWVGTRAGGVNRLKPKQVFVSRHLEDGVEVVPKSLAEAPDGTLWTTSYGRGLYRFEPRGPRQFLRQSLPSLPEVLTTSAICTARDGSLWWGSASRLAQWKDDELVGSFSNPELRDDAVYSLCEDRDQGMWVGTRNGRLLLLREGQFTVFTNGLPGGLVTAMVQQPDGTLWIGSYGGGLGCLKNGVGKTYGRGQGLPSDLVRALCLDSGKHLWVGMEGGGLGWFEEGRFRSFGAQHGVAEDTIVQMLEDDAGDLWLGTYRGILRITRKDLDGLLAGRTSRVHPRRFDRADGLLTEQCAVGFGTCLKTRDGLLCFSTDRGIAVINPRALRDRGRPPVVRLETVLVAGQPQPLPTQPPNPTLPEGGQHTPLTVPAHKRQLEFRFASHYFAAPERVRYRYQLAGLDADWVEAGATRTAYYSFVPPGNYQFRVTAHNGDGRWNEVFAAVSLDVLPHYWETWWFHLASWLGGVALVSGGVVAGLRRRHTLRMRALEHQRAIERERARIAQDMHDELGSRLTKAGMVAQDLEVSASPARLETLRGTLEEMTVTMDELVWAVNPRHDTLDGLANYVIRFTQEFFAGTPIRCEFNIPADLPAAPLTAAIRHNLFLAFKEALNNAAKHAAPTVIVIRLEFAAGEMQIEVKDDGVGFTPADQRAGGRGLENMRDRLEAIGGRCAVEARPGRGTRVRFALALRP